MIVGNKKGFGSGHRLHTESFDRLKPDRTVGKMVGTAISNSVQPERGSLTIAVLPSLAQFMQILSEEGLRPLCDLQRSLGKDGRRCKRVFKLQQQGCLPGS